MTEQLPIIRKVAVLGAGVMGSQIACLLASANLDVLLLDLPPDDPDKELPAQKGLERTLQMKPSPILKKEFARQIEVGDFAHDLPRLHDADWIIEAVVEDPRIKQELYQKVLPHLKASALLTTNTSGIPIRMLREALPQEIRPRFFGTHFFNPPRYLPLLELIPSPEASPNLLQAFARWATRRLGRTVLLCKDTPAFIANRIGVYAMALVFRLMQELDLSIADVDQFTGPVVGRPRSATFRTADLVGLDTLLRVMEFLAQSVPEEAHLFTPPEFLRQLVNQGHLGEKTGKGFYYREYVEGRRIIYMLDWKSGKYVERKRNTYPSLQMAQAEQDLVRRIQILLNSEDTAGQFTRKFFAHLISYAAHHVPEITDEFYQIDDALEAGFGWQMGPFRLWNQLGHKTITQLIQQENLTLPDWAQDAIRANQPLYEWRQNKIHYWSLEKTYVPVRTLEGVIPLAFYPRESIVWQTRGTTLYDLGDHVLALAIHTRMNVIGEEVLTGIQKALDEAERRRAGLIITSLGEHFSAGANLAILLQLAVDGEWEDIDLAVRMFQNVNQRIKYSEVPVIVVPFGLTLGGGCEICLHAPYVVADQETYIGLVEIGVGLIPAGGGTKEMVARASRSFYEGDPEIPHLQQWFLTVAQAKVAESAEQAYDLGLFLPGKDEAYWGRRRLVALAKRKLLHILDAGHIPPRRQPIRVLGRSALSAFQVGIHVMQKGNWITAYDAYLAEKLAYVFCGGDLPEPQEVSEEYLLDLERETFLHLLGQKKTLERIQAVLKTGKPLRN